MVPLFSALGALKWPNGDFFVGACARDEPMLDVAFIREHLDAVKANCRNRNVTVDVDQIIGLDDARRRFIHETQKLQHRRNELSALIPQEKDPARKAQLVAEGKALRPQVEEFEAAQKKAEADLHAAIAHIPNMTHPAAPVGTDSAANQVVTRFGTPRQFDFAPKDHVELAEALDLIDLEAGAAVTGQKFYFLKNEAVLLELALVQYAMQTVLAEGFTPIITPDLARVEVLEGIGFLPRDPDPNKRQIYTIADTDLCLIATAEITLGGMHRDKILDELDLPLRYVGLSHCFRTEAGAPGRDTRGLYRVHQFTKVEMFAYCTPDQAEQIHLDILRLEEKIFQGLGLCYHVLDTCTGDLGGPAYRKYDLEAWMPGRGERGPDGRPKGDFGEITSTSNCTDYQARRLNVRYRPAGQKGTKFVYTLNGTAVAVTRALVAILENYQQADGSIVIPEVLRPWVGKERIVPRQKRV
jgi:seryl-tRNA synthetase